jgi:hypothetical protein
VRLRVVVGTVLLAHTAAVAAVDVSHVTGDELAALKREHFWFGCTVEQARLAWRGKARASVHRNAGNGGEPVLVLLSSRFDASRPYVVQTHFHGDFTAVGAPGGVHTQRIAELLHDEPQRVWVLPEAKGNVGKRGTDWENVKDHEALLREALASVGLAVRADTRLVVSAHSSGGRALGTVAGNGSLRAEQVVLLDCLYESANDALLAAARSGALDAVREIVIVPAGTYPASRDEAMLEAANGRARLEQLIPKKGLSDHAAAVRHHLSPSPPRGRGSG